MTRPKATRIAVLAELPRTLTKGISVEIAEGKVGTALGQFVVLRGVQTVDGEEVELRAFAIYPDEIRTVANALLRAAEQLNGRGVA